MSFFVANAHAQAAGQSAPPGGEMFQIVFLIGLFVLFYVIAIRPQRKRQKEHAEMVSALEKGNEVITSSGILGKITRPRAPWKRSRPVPGLKYPPRIPLARLPTPLEPMDRLRAALGIRQRLWVKRGDLTDSAIGGNKLRKLEFITAAARESGPRPP